MVSEPIDVLPCDREAAEYLQVRIAELTGTCLVGDAVMLAFYEVFAAHRHRQSAMLGRVEAMRDAANKLIGNRTRWGADGAYRAGVEAMCGAAIAAPLPAPGEGAGSEWVLVPRVPTEAMRLAVSDFVNDTQDYDPDRFFDGIWNAFLTAAEAESKPAGTDGGVA